MSKLIFVQVAIVTHVKTTGHLIHVNLYAEIATSGGILPHKSMRVIDCFCCKYICVCVRIANQRSVIYFPVQGFRASDAQIGTIILTPTQFSTVMSSITFVKLKNELLM